MDVDRYIIAHHASLVAERAPIDRAAVNDVQGALQAFLDAVGRWRGAEGAHVQLLRPLDGRDGSEIPQLGLDDVVRSAKSALPGAHPGASPRAARRAG